MHLRDPAIQIGLFRSLPLRCCRVRCNDFGHAILRQASGISIEQWYLRHGRFRKGVKPRPKKPAKPESTIPLNTKDLFVNDLAATLEAHRSTNRAKIIRKIPRGPPQYKDKDWKHLTGIHDGGKTQSESPQHTNKSKDLIPGTIRKKVRRSVPPKTATNWLRTSDSQDSMIVRRIFIEKAAKVRLLNSKRGLQTVCDFQRTESTSAG